MSSTTLTAEECAALLKCSKFYVYEMARNSRIPYSKVGRRYVFIEEDVLNWLRNKVKPIPLQRRLGRPRIRSPHFSG